MDSEEDMYYDYFCTVGSGVETFTINELMDLGFCTIRGVTSGKVYFSSKLSAEALISLKSVERLFILIHREPQFLICQRKRDAISRYRSLVEGDSSHIWEKCLNKWKEFYVLLTDGEYEESNQLKFRVSCKCSGKIKNVFPPQFLGKIFAGSLLNVHPKWIPELRNPKLEVLVNATKDTLTIGLACCIFNKPLSKRSYLPDTKGLSGLRPTLCFAMLTTALKTLRGSLSENSANNQRYPIVLLDPMCGSGMILAEAVTHNDNSSGLILLGSDSDKTQLREAAVTIMNAKNLHGAPHFKCLSEKRIKKKCSAHLFVADARALPLKNNSVDCIVSDLPFGLKHSCTPWPKNLRDLQERMEKFKSDTHTSTIESESPVTGGMHITCNINKFKTEGIAENKEKQSYTNVGFSHGAECINYKMNTIMSDIDESSGHGKGIKRKNSCASISSCAKSVRTNSSGDNNTIEDARDMLPQVIREMDRVLVEGGRAVLLISETLRPCLLEAVTLVTNRELFNEWSSGHPDLTISNINLSEACSSKSEFNSCTLAIPHSNQRCSFEMDRAKVIDETKPKKQIWICSEQHKVRLGVLDAVICVFNK